LNAIKTVDTDLLLSTLYVASRTGMSLVVFESWCSCHCFWW